MKVIKPTVITDAMFSSSTAPETDYPAYSASTAYSVGTYAIVVAANVHKIYQSLQGVAATVTMTISSQCDVNWTAHGLAANTPIAFTTTGALPTGVVANTVYYVLAPLANTFNISATAGGDAINTSGTQSGVHTAISNPNKGNTPATSPTYWVETGTTNRWRMFDDVIGNITTVASPLTVVVNPGTVEGVALLELAGTQAVVTLKSSPSGTTVYTKTVTLDGTDILSFYDWFFEDFVQLDTLTLTDLPGGYTSPELTVSITAPSGNVSCGVLAVGKVRDMGTTEYGAKVGIVDYSRKTTDVFGRTSLVERVYARTLDTKMIFDQSELSRIYKLLSDLRATPCIWISADAVGYSSLTVYGFIRDFSIDVAYPTASYCSLQIEGLT